MTYILSLIAIVVIDLIIGKINLAIRFKNQLKKLF